MSTVNRSIGSLRAFKGQANRAKGAVEGAKGTEGAVGAARAKAKREESY
jgi:hypothetical protein